MYFSRMRTVRLLTVITDRIRSMRKGNVFTAVCLFTGGSAFEGVGLPLERRVCMDAGSASRGQTPHPHRDTVNWWLVHILLAR